MEASDTLEIVDLSTECDARRADESRAGKFVLVHHEMSGQRFLVLASTAQCEYHADIVERFCALDRFDIAGEMLAACNYFLIEEPYWAVEGGGFWEAEAGTGTLRIHGSSQGYGAADFAELIRMGKGRITR
jgi:hypothetical protein